MNNGIYTIIAILAIIWAISSGQNTDLESQQNYNIPYSTFLDWTETGKITAVKINGNTISGITENGDSFETNSTFDSNLIERLRAGGVEFSVENKNVNPFISVLLGWIPILLLIGIWIFVMQRMQGGGGGSGGIFGFGKSKAKMINKENNYITFNDVAGIQEAKQDLEEIVDFLKEPEKFSNLGAKIPKGILLVGPPGTGKTLTARAVAGEANVPFFTISGSDFVEMFVGVGASRVRSMFEEAKKNAPCIIFIDEIDAVGRSRGSGMMGGNDEREQTLNQLLVEMDGFEENLGVIIVAATNRPDVLDSALLRPGRFDRQISVDNADVAGREQILKVHLNKVRRGPDIDERIIARGTPGFSGAQLANIVNEAALLAARHNKNFITMSDIEDAKDKVILGAEKKHSAMTEQEKELTAYHEAGHAICTLHQPASDPIHKATIVPRGRALGMVIRLPEGDRVSMSYEKLTADLVIAMGGRVAEELIYGSNKVTTGASSDIQMATTIAKKMVTEWGMSKKLGKVKLTNDDNMFGVSSQSYSEETSKAIDQEIKELIDDAYNEAKRILTENCNDLETLKDALLEYELLTADDINNLLKQNKKDIDNPSKPEPKRKSLVEIPKTVSKKPI